MGRERERERERERMERREREWRGGNERERMYIKQRGKGRDREREKHQERERERRGGKEKHGKMGRDMLLNSTGLYHGEMSVPQSPSCAYPLSPTQVLGGTEYTAQIKGD